MTTGARTAALQDVGCFCLLQVPVVSAENVKTGRTEGSLQVARAAAAESRKSDDATNFKIRIVFSIFSNFRE